MDLYKGKVSCFSNFESNFLKLNRFLKFQNLNYTKFCTEQIIFYTKVVSDTYFWSKFSYADLYYFYKQLRVVILNKIKVMHVHTKAK